MDNWGIKNVHETPLPGMIKKQRIWGASQRDKRKTKEKKESVESGGQRKQAKKNHTDRCYSVKKKISKPNSVT